MLMCLGHNSIKVIEDHLGRTNIPTSKVSLKGPSSNHYIIPIHKGSSETNLVDKAANADMKTLL